MPLGMQDLASPSVPQAPAVVSVGGGEQTAALASRLQATVERLVSLKLRERSLESQLRAGTASQRADATSQLGDVSHDIATTTADLAQIRAELGTSIGRGVTMEAPMPPATPFPIDGDNLTGIIIVFILAVVLPISIGFARRLWRAAPRRDITPPQASVGDSQRLERLEQAMDAIAIEIERISEGQRFVTKVLSERPASVNGSAAAAADQGGAPRALGAGPIEPVRAAERQSVRRSVTPH